MSVDRRDILKAMIAGGAVAGAPGLGRMAFAAPDDRRDLLVVVYLRGACDGLHLVGPTEDENYVGARPSELRVTASGEQKGHALARPLDAAAGFHLHRDAAPLAELYAAQKLAIVHAVGLTTAQRSHFVAQDMTDKGIARPQDISRIDQGWLARLAAPYAPRGSLFAASTGNALPLSYAGLSSALAIPEVGGAATMPGGAQVRQMLEGLYPTGNGDAVGLGMRGMLDAAAMLDGRIERLPDGKPAPYGKAAEYELNGEAGRALMAVARLAKMDVGLRVAAVDVNGWDTHEGQPGRFANLVGQLSRGLMAFWNDLGPMQDRTTVLVMTEFGRRFRANRSNGTDHGRAGAMLVLGGRVRGGRMHGRWPGLAPEQLEDGVDLAVTTDYRAVLAEAIARRWSRADAQRAFPQYRSTEDMGLFA